MDSMALVQVVPRYSFILGELDLSLFILLLAIVYPWNYEHFYP